MSELLVFLLASYGVCFTLKDSKLPGVLRARTHLMARNSTWFNFLNCPFCVGFHSGWIVYVLWYWNTWSGCHWLEVLTNLVVYGFVAAAFCYFFDTLMIRMEQNGK